MGFLDEIKRLARPYEDEEDEEEFDDYEPVSRSERMDRTGGERLERRSAKSSQENTGTLYPVENERRSNKVVNIHTTTQLQVVLVKPERFENASEIADHLREKCRECLELTVDDAARAARVLEEQLGTRDFEVLPHNKPRLYTFLDQPQTVNRVLLENGVGLISAQQRSCDLEDYFLSLIGGHHAAGKEGF